MNKTLKLRLAAESGDAEIVKQLLNEGASITPDIIFKAVEKKHTGVILELLKTGSEAVRNGVKSACRTLCRNAYFTELEQAELIQQHIDDYGLTGFQQVKIASNSTYGATKPSPYIQSIGRAQRVVSKPLVLKRKITDVAEDLFIELSWNMDNETLMNAVFPGVNK